MIRDSFWFLNTLVHVRISHADSADGFSVLEHAAPFGDSPPLHIHHTEDEVFVVLDGDFNFQLGDTRRRESAGATLLLPKGVAHSYRVESFNGGRWMTITTHGDFERLVRALGRPAERPEPPPPVVPSPQAVEALAKMAREHGIEVVGPPLGAE